MDTYLVTVHIGTSVQVFVSAEDEDQAEELACEQITKELKDKNSRIYKEIEAIEAEVNQKVSNIGLFEAP
jgi:hypothetical protein